MLMNSYLIIIIIWLRNNRMASLNYWTEFQCLSYTAYLVTYRNYYFLFLVEKCLNHVHISFYIVSYLQAEILITLRDVFTSATLSLPALLWHVPRSWNNKYGCTLLLSFSNLTRWLHFFRMFVFVFCRRTTKCCRLHALIFGHCSNNIVRCWPVTLKPFVVSLMFSFRAFGF